MSRIQRLSHAPVLFLVILLTACSSTGPSGNNAPAPTSTLGPPPNAVQISIIYSPEEDAYLPAAMNTFNQTYASGHNPLTGAALAVGEKPIYITGKVGSAGVVMQGVVNAIIAPNNANVARPTIWSPSVSHWLVLANYQAGRDIFDLADSPATANVPVVMAIWESRLKAIQAKNPGISIGWQQLLGVLSDSQGWADYGITGRRTVYYGHTDPYISSAGLSTFIAEFYSSARYNASFTGRKLTLDVVNDPKVQDGVRNIESMIKHYAPRTTEFKEYIGQGPDYVDFVALEENDLIDINRGKTQYKPPEKLVALYPTEGTFWDEHPFAIPNTDWVTAEQHDAAKVFTQFVLSEPIQQTVMAADLRPANPKVALAYPIVPELGVDPKQPSTVLDVPEAAVMAAIQQSWGYVKKQADIWMVVDTSGSMNDQDKIGQVKAAALAFLDQVDARNRLGLVTFSSEITTRVDLDTVEHNKPALKTVINGLSAAGGTPLYDALATVLQKYAADKQNGDRIRAIILLTDGQDTDSKLNKLNDVVNQINATRQDSNPIIVIPIAYGSDADVGTLSSIARASTTKVQSGDPSNIGSILQIISSYF